jgi:hypothetical protein
MTPIKEAITGVSGTLGFRGGDPVGLLLDHIDTCRCGTHHWRGLNLASLLADLLTMSSRPTSIPVPLAR